eukprot:UN30671
MLRVLRPLYKEKILKDQKIPVCICGEELLLTQGSVVYNKHEETRETTSLNCDICRKGVHGNHIVYHCNKGNKKPHESGFDVCLDCAQDEEKLKSVTVESIAKRDDKQELMDKVLKKQLAGMGLFNRKKKCYKIVIF